MCLLRNWSNETSVDESIFMMHGVWGAKSWAESTLYLGMGSDVPNSDTINAELFFGMPTKNPCEQHTWRLGVAFFWLMIWTSEMISIDKRHWKPETT
jgi:hypothetical protein